MIVPVFLAFIQSFASVLTLLHLTVFLWGFIELIIMEGVAFPLLFGASKVMGVWSPAFHVPPRKKSQLFVFFSHQMRNFIQRIKPSHLQGNSLPGALRFHYSSCALAKSLSLLPSLDTLGTMSKYMKSKDGTLSVGV